MIIIQDKIQMDRQTFSSNRWPTPKCVKDVHRSPARKLFNQRFIQGFAHITAPLHSLTGRTPHALGPWPTEGIDTLPTMLYFGTKKFSLSQTSRSQFAWKQMPRLRLRASYHNNQNDGHWLPVAYIVQQMLRRTQTMSSIDKELLAISKPINYGATIGRSPHPVDIWFDHKILNYISIGAVLNCRQAHGAYSFPVFGSLSNRAVHSIRQIIWPEVRSSGGGGNGLIQTPRLHYHQFFNQRHRAGVTQLQKKPYETLSKNQHATIF